MPPRVMLLIPLYVIGILLSPVVLLHDLVFRAVIWLEEK